MEYGTSFNKYQSKIISNQFIGKPLSEEELPPINNIRMRDIEDSRNKSIQKTINFVSDRLKRGIENTGPFNNMNLYHPSMIGFLNNYPSNIMNYRPIRYFFQRPVQLDYNTALPNQRKKLEEIQSKNKKVQKINEQATKFAKPLRFDDLIKEGDELNIAKGTVISAGEVNKHLEDLNKLKEQLYRLHPKNRAKFREQNKQLWAKVLKVRHILSLFRTIRLFTNYSKDVRKDHHMITQAWKADLMELSKWIAYILQDLRPEFNEHLTDILLIDSALPSKKEDCIFKLKLIIHKIFNELSTKIASPNDIPHNIKRIIYNQTKDDILLPEGFLTSFEFNRLEFTIRLRTTNMNRERKAMMIGMNILYRTLLLEVLKNHREYFRVRKSKRGGGNRRDREEGKEEEKKRSRSKRKKREKSPGANEEKNDDNNNNVDRKQINENVNYNFELIMGIIHKILRETFMLSPKIYRESFKDMHLYRHFVINATDKMPVPKIENNLSKDLFEMDEMVPKSPLIDRFCAENFRWINMYKLSSLAFCTNLIDLVNLNNVK